MFNAADAVSACRTLLAAKAAEAEKLDKIHAYFHGKQPLPILVTNGMPQEVKDLAHMSRVNVIRLPVDVMAQSLFVDGYRSPNSDGDEPVWKAWQANRMDARQTPLYRSTLAYGAAYEIVTPGRPYPVIRGASPRTVTALYGDDPDWPMMALEVRQDGSYRVYDAEAVYFLAPGKPREFADDDEIPVDFISAQRHTFGVTPVVRYFDLDDLDGVPCGEVEPLIPLQDQIDHTTFDLLVAQHFGAFRQRYIMGWVAQTEQDKIRVGANRFLTFDDDTVKVGEFSQTDTKPMLDSREATLRHMAIVSQVSPRTLLGQMANLSAEALAAAELGEKRKRDRLKVALGESREQTFSLVATGMGITVSDSAEVRWRNTEAQSLSQTADALGKIAAQLGYPPELLWEMIPEVTDLQLERAHVLKARAGTFNDLAAMLDRTTQQGGVPAPVA